MRCTMDQTVWEEDLEQIEIQTDIIPIFLADHRNVCQGEQRIYLDDSSQNRWHCPCVVDISV